MTIPRIFRESITGEAVLLTADEQHHIARVLRVKAASPIEVVDATSRTLYVGQLGSNDEEVTHLIRHATSATMRSTLQIAIPLLKGGNTEDAVDAVTQLDVDKIYIFESDHGVASFGEKLREKKARFEARILAAAAQSKRFSVPEIQLLPSLDALLVVIRGRVAIVCCALSEERKSLKELSPHSKPLLIMSGPEGDFSSREIELLKGADATFVSLGETILRAELAPVVALSVIKTR